MDTPQLAAGIFIASEHKNDCGHDRCVSVVFHDAGLGDVPRADDLAADPEDFPFSSQLSSTLKSMPRV